MAPDRDTPGSAISLLTVRNIAILLFQLLKCREAGTSFLSCLEIAEVEPIFQQEKSTKQEAAAE